MMPSELAEATMVNELRPKDFKDYDKMLLVIPAFKAIGTKKYFSKRLDKYYSKPYHLAEYTEVASGLEPENYSIEEYKYMIVIQSSKNFSGNTAYSFMLVDRSTNTIYYTLKSGNNFKKYLQKLLK